MAHASIVVFPGSNCDRDCERALQFVGFETSFVWHRDTELPETDLVVLPGGFSYGDYLRAGAVAKVSPIMDAIRSFADGGGYVMGICNGFQILLEVGLLPGAMTRNASLRFICKNTTLHVQNSDSVFTNAYSESDTPVIPIAHGEGNFRIDEAGLQKLKENGQIIFTYADNPNGSLGDIAGICNERGNVLGMMPHPERATDPLLLGWDDGAHVFKSVLNRLEA